MQIRRDRLGLPTFQGFTYRYADDYFLGNEGFMNKPISRSLNVQLGHKEQKSNLYFMFTPNVLTVDNV